MGRMKRVQVSLSPSMEVALQYLAGQEEATEGTVARRIMRAGLDRTIHSAAVQELIAQRKASMTAREFAEFQHEAAEELANEQVTS